MGISLLVGLPPPPPSRKGARGRKESRAGDSGKRYLSTGVFPTGGDPGPLGQKTGQQGTF